MRQLWKKHLYMSDMSWSEQAYCLSAIWVLGNVGNVGNVVAPASQRRHQMMAACDLLLMPSRYEPCGLPQMYSQMFGTQPSISSPSDSISDSISDSRLWSFLDVSGTERCPWFMLPVDWWTPWRTETHETHEDLEDLEDLEADFDRRRKDIKIIKLMENMMNFAPKQNVWAKWPGRLHWCGDRHRLSGPLALTLMDSLDSGRFSSVHESTGLEVSPLSSDKLKDQNMQKASKSTNTVGAQTVQSLRYAQITHFSFKQFSNMMQYQNISFRQPVKPRNFQLSLLLRRPCSERWS